MAGYDPVDLVREHDRKVHFRLVLVIPRLGRLLAHPICMKTLP